MAEKFRYYNHSLVPNCLQNETIDFSKSELKEAFKKNKKAMFFCYTSHYDCKYETGWYFVINNTGTKHINFSSSNLKRKINVIKKNVLVKQIDPIVYFNDLKRVTESATLSYKKYDRRNMPSHFDKWGGVFIGAFVGETLIGFVHMKKQNKQIDLSYEKTDLNYKKYYPSLALNLYAINHCCDFESGEYLTNGSKTISHVSNHNQFLIDYLGYRKAYCYLHIVYRPMINCFMPFLRFFSPLLKLFDKNNKIHLINSLLKMDKIARMQKKEFKDYVQEVF